MLHNKDSYSNFSQMSLMIAIMKDERVKQENGQKIPYS
jgi:hypothetical protein